MAMKPPDDPKLRLAYALSIFMGVLAVVAGCAGIVDTVRVAIG